MNDDAKKNGWPEWRMMTTLHGPVNDLILEAEYSDPRLSAAVEAAAPGDLDSTP
jgi:hypothetical protein